MNDKAKQERCTACGEPCVAGPLCGACAFLGPPSPKIGLTMGDEMFAKAWAKFVETSAEPERWKPWAGLSELERTMFIVGFEQGEGRCNFMRVLDEEYERASQFKVTLGDFVCTVQRRITDELV